MDWAAILRIIHNQDLDHLGIVTVWLDYQERERRVDLARIMTRSPIPSQPYLDDKLYDLAQHLYGLAIICTAHTLALQSQGRQSELAAEACYARPIRQEMLRRDQIFTSIVSDLSPSPTEQVYWILKLWHAYLGLQEQKLQAQPQTVA